VDLDDDGNLDVLSGSYSRMDTDMAGLFQVLRGRKDGTFAKAEVLNGSDGKPLILPRRGGLANLLKRLTGDQPDDFGDRICTRPFAADLDGDGNLDLVSGNVTGTFAFFAGQGSGKFAPQATWLSANGKKMAVPCHSDPFLVDWDKDGDLDLLSGSFEGGAFLFPNTGSRTEPKFGAMVTLLTAPGRRRGEEVRFGDAHHTAPGAYTRLWVDDVNGDGKLDLLLGDQVDLMHLVEGVTEADARVKLAAWTKEQTEFFEQRQGKDASSRKKWQDAYEKLEKRKQAFVKDESTGFVWLLLQK